MKCMLLLSGGIDSPVAGWILKKSGLHISAVHFSFEPLTDNEPEVKSRTLAKKLDIPLEVVNIAKELKQIADKCEKKYYFVLMKRLMMRKAEALAKKQGCSVLVTGENLGQVSSQTLENLEAIDPATQLPVLRPLISMDKQEIVSIAEKIGTFETSKGREVCDVLGPDHPSTKARLADILEQEKRLS